MDETNVRTRSEEDFFDTTRIAIEGMTCDKCVETIERAFRGKEGIRDIKADHANSFATITYDRRRLDVPALHDLLLEHGYRARRTADDEVPAVGPVA
jgi:copper chaperone CopZ